MHGSTWSLAAWATLLCLTATSLAAGPPEAFDDTYSTLIGDNLSVDAPGVLANDVDPDEDPLTAELVDGPAPGAIVNLAPDGSFEYEPPEGFSGSDTFTYRAFDGTAHSNVATVTVTVSGAAGRVIYLDAAQFLADLTAMGLSVLQEGFEDDVAWGSVRSTIVGGQHTAPSVTSQHITWTSNNDVSEITTGPGPARSGEWGFFTLPHGNQATGTDCHIPGNCTDGFVLTAALPLYAAGGWIEGTFGGEVEFFLDGDTTNPVDFGNQAGLTAAYKFFGVIDPAGFTSLEVHEVEGAAEDQKFVFADDFTFGVAPSAVTLAVRPGPGTGELTLEWLGGGPPYSVRRASDPSMLVDPLSEVAQTADTFWVDFPPAGDLLFYRVFEP